MQTTLHDGIHWSLLCSGHVHCGRFYFDVVSILTLCVGLYYLLMLLTLEVRVRVITVSVVNAQLTATMCHFFTHDSVSESKSEVSNHSDLCID